MTVLVFQKSLGYWLTPGELDLGKGGIINIPILCKSPEACAGGVCTQHAIRVGAVRGVEFNIAANISSNIVYNIARNIADNVTSSNARNIVINIAASSVAWDKLRDHSRGAVHPLRSRRKSAPLRFTGLWPVVLFYCIVLQVDIWALQTVLLCIVSRGGSVAVIVGVSDM